MKKKWKYKNANISNVDLEHFLAVETNVKNIFIDIWLVG